MSGKSAIEAVAAPSTADGAESQPVFSSQGTGKGLLADIAHSMFNPGTPQSVAILLNVIFVALGFILALFVHEACSCARQGSIAWSV